MQLAKGKAEMGMALAQILGQGVCAYGSYEPKIGLGRAGLSCLIIFELATPS